MCVKAYDISQPGGRSPDADVDILEDSIETFEARTLDYSDKIDEIYRKLLPVLEGEGMPGNDPYAIR